MGATAAAAAANPEVSNGVPADPALVGE